MPAKSRRTAALIASIALLVTGAVPVVAGASNGTDQIHAQIHAQQIHA
jgi:hypothetical protein